MTRNGFIRGLKFWLGWHFDAAEVKLVVSDYEEYFDEGAKLNKTEQQLCTEFGEPSEIVAKLVPERKIIAHRKWLNEIWVAALMIGTLIITSMGIWYFWGGKVPMLAELCTVVIPILVMGIATNWKPKQAWNQSTGTKYINFILGGLLVFVVFTFVVGYLHTRNIQAIFDRILSNRSSAEEATNDMYGMLRLPIYSAVMLWYIILLLKRKISRYWISIVFILSGIIWTAVHFYVDVLGDLDLSADDAIARFLVLLDKQWAPLIIGVTAAIISAIWLGRKEKGQPTPDGQ